LPKSDQQAADELIAGTDKDPTRVAQLSDADPAAEPEGSGDDEPAMTRA
jgi:hypothetical protein